MMLVVSDTSPVTALIQIGKADLLPRLFDRVRIPPAVKTELLKFHSFLPGYIEVQNVENQPIADALSQKLDRGEAEAIVLAEELRADYVLMDEKHGRIVAESRGLQVIGLLGVLLMAKKTGLVSSLRMLIAELESRAGFFVSDTVKQIILRAAGEET